jgi:hypothetical protein
MKVIENTYPKQKRVPHAKKGDKVYWELDRGAFRLIRDSDNKVVFCTAPVNKDGKLRSNGKAPKLIGLIAEVKIKGWRLEVGNEEK